MTLTHWTRPLATLTAAALLLACGDDTPEPRTDFLPAVEVPMSKDIRGLTVAYSGSLVALSAQLTRDAAEASAVVIVEQIYSEIVHVTTGSSPRDPRPRFDESIDVLFEDNLVADAIAQYDRTYWLVDLHRLDREWLLDWNGLDRDSPDTRDPVMTFAYRSSEEDGDYQEAIIDRVVSAFEDAEPRPQSVVIGSEMERHYDSVASDWPAFVALVRDLTAALRAVEPSVRVAVGFNWSNFMDEVVPQFVGASGQSEVNYQAVDLAWETVIAPVYFDGLDSGTPTAALDFYAFTAVPDATRYSSPADVSDDHFTGVATYFSEHRDHQLSVAWVGIGWPIAQRSSGFLGDFWDIFQETAGGYDMELVTWWGYNHLKSDDCQPYTQSIGVTNSVCFRGLYSESGAPVSQLRDPFFTDAQE